MQQLKKTVLAQVAGGTADEVVFNDATGGGWDSGDGWDSGGGWDSGNDMGDTGSSNNVLAGVGTGQAAGNFDANGVGPTSCVVMMPPPAPVAQGVFGLTLAETTGAATAALAISGGIGGGVVASNIVQAAGGWGAVGEMGVSGLALGPAAGVGILSAGAAGFAAGTLLYEHSETVQDVSQAVVGRVIEVAPEIPGAVGDALMDTFNGKNLGRAGVGP